MFGLYSNVCFLFKLLLEFLDSFLKISLNEFWHGTESPTMFQVVLHIKWFCRFVLCVCVKGVFTEGLQQEEERG